MQCLKSLVLIICTILLTGNVYSEVPVKNGSINVLDFLPENFVRDGSVSYRDEIQKAIDTALGKHLNLVFPPMKYLVSETGLKLGSDITLYLDGAVFILPEDCNNDGQVF